MPKICCKERNQLEQAVADAMRRADAASLAERSIVRVAKCKAVNALNRHIKEHGCRNEG
jgi:hypothetical protein